jgi:hypothetical protein
MHMKNIQISGCMHPLRQFEGKVVMDPESDSKSDSAIPIWIGSPRWRAHLIGSPTLS